MSKIKKYIYPVAFSAIFIILYMTLVMVINAVIDRGDYAGAALAVLFILAWVFVAVPFYCVRYSKIIIDEKLKWLFSAYNVLVLITIHPLPFNFDSNTYGFLVMFVVWVVFWNVLPLILRLISRKNKDDPSKKEDLHLVNSLLQNKKKNIAAICITCLYIRTLITDSMVWHFFDISSFLLYTLPLISAVLVLVFLCSKNTEYLLKKWLLSFALTGELVSGLFSICLSLSFIDTLLKQNPGYYINIIFSCLMNLLIAVMLIGTFFNFKYIKLLKYGALGCAILAVGVLIFGLINVGGAVYRQIDMSGSPTVNISVVVDLLSRALYFVGIFILTTNKSDSDLA